MINNGVFHSKHSFIQSIKRMALNYSGRMNNVSVSLFGTLFSRLVWLFSFKNIDVLFFHLLLLYSCGCCKRWSVSSWNRCYWNKTYVYHFLLLFISRFENIKKYKNGKYEKVILQRQKHFIERNKNKNSKSTFYLHRLCKICRKAGHFRIWERKMTTRK